MHRFRDLVVGDSMVYNNHLRVHCWGVLYLKVGNLAPFSRAYGQYWFVVYMLILFEVMPVILGSMCALNEL